MLHTSFLLLGSNIGNREEYLQKARLGICQTIGTLLKASGCYETEAWGKTDVPSYLNQVLSIETSFSAEKLLAKIQEIENDIGRTRLKKWDSRVIDIDILYYDNSIIMMPNLQIPHPYLHQRRFTLVPLVEIAPLYIHPILKKTSLALLEECDDSLEVRLLNH